ncbi:MAG: MiaB/RimO family radical SAM methylthiotransferase [Coriobacteriales bacterium]|jgi:tRNA-2-methylthio-N6-dimethylallyladenosine synthase|nr:MiaB/RimO family radical SAM methylthiotransferase [Coriobacteriales bacterium]
MLKNRTYKVITFGCQMNKSDSERVCGMLDALGAAPFDKEMANVAPVSGSTPATGLTLPPTPDIIIFMTCCVRQAADSRLFGQVAALKDSPALIAVGGCLGQRDGAKLRERLPHIDVVFGTHNITRLPQLLNKALTSGRAQVEVLSDAEADAAYARAALVPVAAEPPKAVRVVAPSEAVGAAAPGTDITPGTDTVLGGDTASEIATVLDGDIASGIATDSDIATASVGALTPAPSIASAPPFSVPARREHPWHAWLPIMSGCNNFCSYCIVPYVRGRERSLPIEQLEAQVAALLADGVVEISLLGQNVNSYGRDLYGQPRFAQLLERLSNLGVPRLRFFTSHPKDLSASIISSFAREAAVMPALHLPVQSGSDRVLRAMNRNYSARHYLRVIESTRQAAESAGKPPVAFSTDVIVGFPGEQESDFEQTLRLVEQVGFAQVFTFIYSPRAGTPAAQLINDIPRQVVQERFQRLVALVQQSAHRFNQYFVGSSLPVLFTGASKRDTSILAGKSPANQTVHVPLPPKHTPHDFAGRIVPVRITEAKTWYLSGQLV